ncbi:MAG: hypothetical protein EHM58_04725 [Ignavibacteriae bacterium]|nr:MAG: hypothetical protein EHM58_04725 [Ignavibacteriota bacterium]
MINKKKKAVAPEVKQVLAELEEVVQRLGFTVRYEKGNFEGGYCLLKESKLFVINSRNEPEKRISIIARNLKDIGVDDIFIKPHLRELIDSEAAKKNKKDTPGE